MELTEQELNQKLLKYQEEKNELENQIKETEKAIIIKEERFNQVKENLEKVFGTSELTELEKIKSKLIEEIGELEREIQ